MNIYEQAENMTDAQRWQLFQFLKTMKETRPLIYEEAVALSDELGFSSIFHLRDYALARICMKLNLIALDSHFKTNFGGNEPDGKPKDNQ